MEGTSLSIRPAEETDLAAIVTLFEMALGDAGSVPSIEFWRWKHEQNPFGRSPTLLMVTGSDQVVGLRTFMYWQWSYQGQVLTSLRCVDTATHPDFRGRGIFKTLTLRLVDQCRSAELADFIFNTPNDISRPGYLKMGWESAGRTDLYIKPKWRQLLSGRDRGSPVGSVGHTTGFDAERLAPLAEHVRDVENGLLSTRYSPTYFKWRYLDVPEIQYDLWFQESVRGRIDAVFFYRTKVTRGFRELRILDYLWTDRSARTALFDGIEQVAAETEAQLVSLLRNPLLPRRELLWRGFVPLRSQSLEITKRALNNKEAYSLLDTTADWNLTAGVVELF